MADVRSNAINASRLAAASVTSEKWNCLGKVIPLRDGVGILPSPDVAEFYPTGGCRESSAPKLRTLSPQMLPDCPFWLGMLGSK